MYESFQVESYGFYCNPADFFKMILEHVALAMLPLQNM